jgi:hypothetical protein
VTRFRTIACAAPLVAVLLGGCAATPPDGGTVPGQPADRRDLTASTTLNEPAAIGRAAEVAALEQAILALGPGVDPEEAARAARIAYDHTDVLVQQYQITDPPLIHNMKVNAGLRPRGLCWHWAEDIENRLAAENFTTLDMHRAIANADVAFRIDHSTAIISAKGDDMYDGLVLDPWRTGGEMVWAPTRDDKYPWKPQQQVLAVKAERLAQAD